MKSGSMPRRDEGFMAIAFCLRRTNSNKLRNHIYDNIGELLVTDVDLFMFVKYATLLKKPEEASPQEPTEQPGLVPDAVFNPPVESTRNKTKPVHGFGRGMKKAISQWYTSRTPDELADIMGRRRGLYRWTHRDLFKLCHVKFDETQKDKVQIMKAMFNRGVKVLRDIDSVAAQDGPTGGMIRLCQIFRFKMCEEPKAGANMFIMHNFDMDQVPSHFLADHDFWTLALPHVPYLDMLRILLTLHGYGLLAKHSKLKQIFLDRLDNREQVIASKVQPLHLLALINGYKAGRRYSEAIKVSKIIFGNMSTIYIV